MGGGDLNLKKSWHPSTIRNIERVWKAEQKHEAEQKKIEQLQRELTEERCREEIQHYAEDKGVVSKKGERLDWMYQGPAALIDNDQYLLGRKVDTTFEVLRLPQDTQTGIDEASEVPSIFSSTSGNATADLGNKIREDPLFAIRKHEKEQKTKLLDNPVKLKQLRQMLEQSVNEDKKSSRKKRKHKHKNHSSSDKLDMPRKSQGVEHHNKEKHWKPTSSRSSSSQKRKYSGGRQFSDDSDDDADKDITPAKLSRRPLERRDFKDNRNSHSRQDLKMRDKQAGLSSHSHKPAKAAGHLDKIQMLSRHTSNHEQFLPKNTTSDQKHKLSQEEMDSLRQEMMDNASWREEQRKKNINRYKEEDNQELVLQKSGKGASFIRPMLSSAAAKGSVEGRIKQKMYNIQRSKSAMEENFARR